MYGHDLKSYIIKNKHCNEPAVFEEHPMGALMFTHDVKQVLRTLRHTLDDQSVLISEYKDIIEAYQRREDNMLKAMYPDQEKIYKELEHQAQALSKLRDYIAQEDAFKKVQEELNDLVDIGRLAVMWRKNKGTGVKQWLFEAIDKLIEKDKS